MSMYTWDKNKKKDFIRNWHSSHEVKVYKQVLFKKQKGRCPICKIEMIFKVLDQRDLSKSDRYRLATLDHTKPLSDGGPAFDFDNLRLICHLCNSSRNNY